MRLKKFNIHRSIVFFFNTTGKVLHAVSRLIPANKPRNVAFKGIEIVPMPALHAAAVSPEFEGDVISYEISGNREGYGLRASADFTQSPDRVVSSR